MLKNIFAFCFTERLTWDSIETSNIPCLEKGQGLSNCCKGKGTNFLGFPRCVAYWFSSKRLHNNRTILILIFWSVGLRKSRKSGGEWPWPFWGQEMLDVSGLLLIKHSVKQNAKIFFSVVTHNRYQKRLKEIEKKFEVSTSHELHLHKRCLQVLSLQLFFINTAVRTFHHFRRLMDRWVWVNHAVWKVNKMSNVE